MKIAVLGTGTVGATIGTRLIEIGHEVKMGSRTAMNEKALAWVGKNGAKATQGTFREAAQWGEVIFNCTKGEVTVAVLNAVGEDALKGKILVDISNPLDFSKGMPPSLSIVNTDSLGETIQRSFPSVKVVKTLNTMAAPLMVHPNALAGGDHHVFVSGNDPDSKAKVVSILNQFGWQDGSIIDLGDITTARGTEQLLPIWLRLWSTLGTFQFNFKIVR